jgi:DhnA family fructose-bisphosphate aldolase class Ia
MTNRVREILSWYGSDNPGVRTNLARLLNHGRLGGTGKLIILPVDQGFLGSIIGRNSFQRERVAALRLLDGMMRIYGGDA